jgi:histidine ammonia-lyase
MEAVHQEIRKVIPHITEDQMMEDILSAAQQLISSGCLVQVAKQIAEEQHVPYHGLHHEYFNNF